MVFKLLCIYVYIVLAVSPLLNADIIVIPGDSRTEEKDGKYRTITKYYVSPPEYHSNDDVSISNTKTGKDFSQNSDVLDEINSTNRKKIKYVFEMRPKNKYNHGKDRKNINSNEDISNKVANNEYMLNEVVDKGEKENIYNTINKFTSNVQQGLSAINERYGGTDDDNPDYLKVLPKLDDAIIIKNEIKENIGKTQNNSYEHDVKLVDEQEMRTEVNPFELTSMISITHEQSQIKPINKVYIGFKPYKQDSLENMPTEDDQYKPTLMDGINIDTTPHAVHSERLSKKISIAALNKEFLETGKNELKPNETDHVLQAYNIWSSFFNQNHELKSTENFRLFFKVLSDAAGKNFEDFWELLDRHFHKEHGKGENLFELEKLYSILTAFTLLNRAAKLGYPIENTVNKIVDALQQSFGHNIDAITVTNILKNITNDFNAKKNDETGNIIDFSEKYDLASIGTNEKDEQNLPRNENSKENNIFENANKMPDQNILAYEAPQYLNLENNQTSIRSPIDFNLDSIYTIWNNIPSISDSVTATSETVDAYSKFPKTSGTMPYEGDELVLATSPNMNMKLLDYNNMSRLKHISDRNSSNEIIQFLHNAKNYNSNTIFDLSKVTNLTKNYHGYTDNPKHDATTSKSNGIHTKHYNYENIFKLNPNDIDISKLQKPYMTDLIKDNLMRNNSLESVHFTQESPEMHDIRNGNNHKKKLENTSMTEFSFLYPHIEDTISSKFENNPPSKYKQNALIEDSSEINNENSISPDSKGPNNITLLDYEYLGSEENSQIPEITNINISENDRTGAGLIIVTDKNSGGFPLMTGSLTTTEITNISRTPSIKQYILQVQKYDDLNSNPSIKVSTQIPMLKFEYTTNMNPAFATLNQNLNSEVIESAYDLDSGENKESTQSIRNESKIIYKNITSSSSIPYSVVTTEKSASNPLTMETLKQAYSPTNFVNTQKEFIEQMQKRNTNNYMPNKACIKVNSTQLVPIICSEDHLKHSNESRIHPNEKKIQKNMKFVENIPVYYDLSKNISKLHHTEVISKIQHNNIEYRGPNYINLPFLLNKVESDYFNNLSPVINKLEKDTPHDNNNKDIRKEIEDIRNALDSLHNSVNDDVPQMERISYSIPETKNDLNEKPYATQIHFHDVLSPEYYTENNNSISNKNVVEDVLSYRNNNDDIPPFLMKTITFQKYFSTQKPVDIDIGTHKTQSFEFPQKYKKINDPLSYKNRVSNFQIEEELLKAQNGKEKSRNDEKYYKMEPWIQYNIPNHVMENRGILELGENIQQYNAPIPYEGDAAGIFPDDVKDKIHFAGPTVYDNSRNGGHNTPQIAFETNHFPNPFLVHQAYIKPISYFKKNLRLMKHKASKLKNPIKELQPNSIHIIPDSNLIEKYTNIYEPVYIPEHFNRKPFDSEEFNMVSDKDNDLPMNIAHLINKLKDPDVPVPDIIDDDVQNIFRSLQPNPSMKVNDSEDLDGNVVGKLLYNIVQVLRTSDLANDTIYDIVIEIRNNLLPVVKSAYSCCNEMSSSLDEAFENVINFISE